MDAYMYQAALWCGPCVIKQLVVEGKASPGALDMSPANALEQIITSNGFTSEHDYDSDDLPKGPYDEGGGEADTPQHCDQCHVFLENPLTRDGYDYVADAVVVFITSAGTDGNADVIAKWFTHYEMEVRRP